MAGEEKKRLNDVKEDLTQETPGGTLLHEAVQKKDFRLVQHLIMNGSKVNVLDHHGESPLDLAFKAARDDSLSENLSNEEAKQIKAKNRQILTLLCKSRNVPPDGNCLFWAVAVAYLLPVKDKAEDFQNRLQNLFGFCDEATTTSIHATLQQYNPFSDIANLTKNFTFKEKVTNVFRQRVVDYMFSNCGHFKWHVELDDQNLKKYLQLNTSQFENFIKEHPASNFNQFLEQNPLQFKLFVESNKSKISNFCNDNKTSFKRYIENEEGYFNVFLQCENQQFESYDKVNNKTKLISEILKEANYRANLEQMRIPGSNLFSKFSIVTYLFCFCAHKCMIVKNFGRYFKNSEIFAITQVNQVGKSNI